MGSLDQSVNHDTILSRVVNAITATSPVPKGRPNEWAQTTCLRVFQDDQTWERIRFACFLHSEISSPPPFLLNKLCHKQAARPKPFTENGGLKNGEFTDYPRPARIAGRNDFQVDGEVTSSNIGWRTWRYSFWASKRWAQGRFE